LIDRYHRAWVFCLPSSYEGFGIPYAEALAAQLPVVATPNDGSRYILDNGRAGVLCQPEQLGEEILSLLTDAKRRTELEQSGLSRAQDFDLRLIAAQYEKAYWALLERHTSIK